MELCRLHDAAGSDQSGRCQAGQGALPSCAPLAYPYIPFQPENSERFDAPDALAQGTLFPSLALPLAGQNALQPKSGSMLDQLQALGFAVNELGLYLDTHPEDAEATSLFNQYAELYEQSMQQYEQGGGILTQLESAQSGSYQWLSQPWPWDDREG